MLFGVCYNKRKRIKMTRDEAKKEWAKVHPLDLDLDSVIDVIYDYFEKRTCRTCKYCDTRDTPMVCMKMDVPTSYADIPDEKYGCTRWEIK